MSTKHLLIIMLALLFFQIPVFIPNASANSAFTQDMSKIKVHSVAHTVELLEGGLIVINDTLTVSADENVSVNFPIARQSIRY